MPPPSLKIVNCDGKKSFRCRCLWRKGDFFVVSDSGCVFLVDIA